MTLTTIFASQSHPNDSFHPLRHQWSGSRKSNQKLFFFCHTIWAAPSLSHTPSTLSCSCHIRIRQNTQTLPPMPNQKNAKTNKQTLDFTLKLNLINTIYEFMIPPLFLYIHSRATKTCVLDNIFFLPISLSYTFRTINSPTAKTFSYFFYMCFNLTLINTNKQTNKKTTNPIIDKLSCRVKSSNWFSPLFFVVVRLFLLFFSTLGSIFNSKILICSLLNPLSMYFCRCCCLLFP